MLVLIVVICVDSEADAVKREHESEESSTDDSGSAEELSLADSSDNSDTAEVRVTCLEGVECNFNKRDKL